jgi:hypothetical protein
MIHEGVAIAALLSLCREDDMSGEHHTRGEKRYMTEAMALGSALQDALRDLVKVHGVEYLDTFLERQLRDTVEELRCDSGLNVPGILAAQRSAADDAEGALRREIQMARSSPNLSRKAPISATSSA